MDGDHHLRMQLQSNLGTIHIPQVLLLHHLNRKGQNKVFNLAHNIFTSSLPGAGPGAGGKQFAFHEKLDSQQAA